MELNRTSLKPNISTFYACVGILLAIAIGNPFSIKLLSETRAIPLIIVCLAALYISSTLFGAHIKYSAINRKLWWHIYWGLIVALTVLFVTGFITSTANLLLTYYYEFQNNQALAKRFNIPADQLQISDVDYVWSQLFRPLQFVLFWGCLPASILGIIYGFHSWLSYRKR